MELRCLLFTSDHTIAEPVCQVLAELGVEGEHCSEAVAAVERVTNQPYQIVIIDWDAQPEAGLLLTTARERKASERPLTLAIVSDDASVPQALQAGANSILRKPIMVNQVTDTLTTARDLLRAKQDSAATAAQAAAAGAAASSTSTVFDSASSFAPHDAGIDSGNEKTLHPGEFLQTSGSIPGRQFVIDAETNGALEHAAEPVDALKDLEPVASSVAPSSTDWENIASPPQPPAPDEPRGLQWYLNARAAAKAQAPAVAAAPPTPAKPELLAFDQTPSYSEHNSDQQASLVSDDASWAPTPAAVSEPKKPRLQAQQEQKAEDKLFAYISGEREAKEVKPEQKPRPHFRLGGGSIIAASLLAACAIAATPQAPWHPQMRALWARGQHALHVWLNPQPVTTAQAPESHESFGRAGDEYKLPAAENIPDATTDPSQIHVVPMVDPTAKKPNATGGTPDPAVTTAPVDPSAAPLQANPDSASQPGAAPVQSSDPTSLPASNPPQSAAAPTSGNTPVPSPVVAAAATPPATAAQPTAPVATPPSIVPEPAPVKSPQPHYASSPTNVPSSLKSQIASMTPDAGGDKPPEAAMQSIEPVVVTEAAERALLTDQPAVVFPASAKGQHGTVILQVVVGRDGTVQDAKFLQGSFAFARTAIDGVKLWKFKPYSMNGRAVSVQTQLTMNFKPGS